jgi:hypothetical protein
MLLACRSCRHFQAADNATPACRRGLPLRADLEVHSVADAGGFCASYSPRPPDGAAPEQPP